MFQSILGRNTPPVAATPHLQPQLEGPSQAVERIDAVVQEALPKGESDWAFIQEDPKFNESDNRPEALVVIPIESKKALPKAFKEAWLTRFITSIGQVITTAMEVVHEKDLKAPLESIQNHAKDIPTLAQKGAHVFFELGIGINSKFEQFIANYQIDKEPSPEFMEAIAWLTNDKYAPQAGQVAELFDKLKKIDVGLSLACYRTSLARWLLTQPKSGSLMQALEDGITRTELQKKEQIKEVKKCLQLIVNYLLEAKVEQLALRFSKVLAEQLPGTVMAHLCNELAIPVVRIELEKAGDIIRTMPWKRMVDSLVEKLRDFAQATNVSLSNKENFLKKFKNKTDENETQSEFVMQSSYVGARQISTAHPITRCVEYARQHDHDDVATRDKAEHEFLNTQINKILEMILPTDPDSIAFWKEQISLPKPFADLIEQAKTLAYEIINPSIMEFLEVIPKSLRGEMEQIIVNRVKSFIVKTAVEEILTKLDRFTDPDKIDELMVKKILPGVVPSVLGLVLNHNLMETILDTKKNQKERTAFSEILYTYFQNKNDASRKVLKDYLQEIYQKQFKLELTPSQLDKAYESVIADLNKRLPERASTPSELLSHLSGTYKAESVKSAASIISHAMKSSLKQVKGLVGLASGDPIVVENIQTQLRSIAIAKLQQEKIKEVSSAEIDKHSMHLINHLNEKLNNIRHREGKLTMKDVETFFHNYLAEEDAAEKNITVYVDLINHLIDMTTFGSFIKSLTSNGISRSILESVLKKATKDLRSSPEFLFSLLAEELPGALDKEALDDIIYVPPSDSKEPLRAQLKALKAKNDVQGVANHELTKQRVSYEKQMLNVATLVHKFVHLIVDWESDHNESAAVRGLLNGLTKIGIYNSLGSPKELAANITKVKNSLLGSQFRTKDIAYQVIDLAVNSLYAQWKQLQPHTSEKKS